MVKTNIVIASTVIALLVGIVAGYGISLIANPQSTDQMGANSVRMVNFGSSLTEYTGGDGVVSYNPTPGPDGTFTANVQVSGLKASYKYTIVVAGVGGAALPGENFMNMSHSLTTDADGKGSVDVSVGGIVQAPYQIHILVADPDLQPPSGSPFPVDATLACSFPLAFQNFAPV